MQDGEILKTTPSGRKRHSSVVVIRPRDSVFTQEYKIKVTTMPLAR